MNKDGSRYALWLPLLFVGAVGLQAACNSSSGGSDAVFLAQTLGCDINKQPAERTRPEGAPASAGRQAPLLPPAAVPEDRASTTGIETEKCAAGEKACMDICCPAGWICSHGQNSDGPPFPKCLRPREQ
jgi:hypothetical protein